MHVRACLYHDVFPGAFVEAGSVYLYIRIYIVTLLTFYWTAYPITIHVGKGGSLT